MIELTSAELQLVAGANEDGVDGLVAGALMGAGAVFLQRCRRSTRRCHW